MEPSNEPAKNSPETVATRAGETGHNVRYVLGFGIAGVVAVFVIVLIFWLN